MKILLYSANFAPEPTGIGKYSGEMAAWLVARGHSVRAISAPPYYPSWQVDEKYRGKAYVREQIDGVDVWRAPLWVPKRPTGLTRIIHLLTFALTSFPLALRQIFWGPDLVVVVAPAFVCAPAAWLTARLSGAQAWLHMQDFEVDIAFKMNLMRGSLLRRVVLRMESWMLRRFDLVSSISGRMTERLLMKGVDPKRVRYFPNWVDMAQIKSQKGSLGSAAYRASLGISPHDVVVLFSGTLGGKQGLGVIPRAAQLLAERRDIVFVICGDGMMKAELEEAARELPNLRMLPLQPLENLGDLLGMADVHLLPQQEGAADLVLPSKLSGMLASGRPVIATCLPGSEIQNVVSECGAVVPPADAVALAAAVQTLADAPARRAELGKRAREYAEHQFERDAVLTRVFAPLEGDEDSVPDNVVA